MANANASRPGNNQQATAGKLVPQIPKEVKLVTEKDGKVVRFTEYESGTVRRTNVFAGDHDGAAPYVAPKSEALIRAELMAELRAEIAAEGVANVKAEDDAAVAALATAAQEATELAQEAEADRAEEVARAQAVIDAQTIKDAQEIEEAKNEPTPAPKTVREVRKAVVKVRKTARTARAKKVAK